jgi:hypothetical protein
MQKDCGISAFRRHSAGLFGYSDRKKGKASNAKAVEVGEKAVYHPILSSGFSLREKNSHYAKIMPVFSFFRPTVRKKATFCSLVEVKRRSEAENALEKVEPH